MPNQQCAYVAFWIKPSMFHSYIQKFWHETTLTMYCKCVWPIPFFFFLWYELYQQHICGNWLLYWSFVILKFMSCSMETITLGDKRIGIKTSVLEEKATACNMLCCYADELKEGFYPWIDQVGFKKALIFFHTCWVKLHLTRGVNALNRLLRR